MFIEFIVPYNQQEEVLMPTEATGRTRQVEKTWKIERTDERTISISGKLEDMGIIAHHLMVLERANGIGGASILKVKGFPLSSFRECYSQTILNPGSVNESHGYLDESFDVQCKFEEGRGYVVMHSSRRQEFPLGSIVP